MRTLFAFCIFFSACFFLQAGFQDHLHPITDKVGDHSVKNIDFIYVINLDRRPDRLQKIERQFHPYGIYPYRFSAINGWELPVSVINDVGYHFDGTVGRGKMATWYPPNRGGKSFHEKMDMPGRTYFCHCLAPGTLGILLSHLSILQDAYDSGYETVWIMEDDVELIQNPHLVSSMVKKLDRIVGKKNWDILFTDQDMKSATGEYIPCLCYAWRPFIEGNKKRFPRRQKIGKYFSKIGARYGAHSYIIRRSGVKKILQFLQERELFLPYDMEYMLPSGINLYCVNEDIVSNRPNSISDNGVPRYKEIN